MVQVDFNRFRERDLSIDLECGVNALIKEEDKSTDSGYKSLLSRVWNSFLNSDTSNKNEGVNLGNNYTNAVELVLPSNGGEDVSPLLSDKKKAGGDKPIKKSCKKPPKPPRPPRAPSLDAADQKLMREISELAMLKRARIERMKALKRMKNARSASPGSNLFALVITLIFCIMIIWQGLFSRERSSLNFHGSPESAAAARGGFISVQVYSNLSMKHDSNSASPNNIELSGHDDEGEAIRGT